MWTRIVPLLKSDSHVTDLDRTLVEAFCVNYQQMREAYDNIQKNGQVKAAYKVSISPVTGEIVSKDFSGYKRNPATQILDSSSKNIKAIASELGLTPQSRSDLLALPNDSNGKENMSDMMQKFFGKSKD
ncbi:terminase [Pediococcus claussenii]|nr:terminase [Pediococcus claussenii]ANZ72358.1 terminase [Pediococcus claussenii]